MSNIFKVGAPSKGFESPDCAAFEYPATVVIENHVRRLVLPQFHLDLLADFERGETLPSAVIETPDEMRRLFSDLEQLSELNDWSHAVTIAVGTAEDAQKASEAARKKAAEEEAAARKAAEEEAAKTAGESDEPADGKGNKKGKQ